MNFIEHYQLPLAILAGALLVGILLANLARTYDWIRRPLMVAYLIAAITYLVWRPLYSIPFTGVDTWSTIVGVGFYLIELWGFMQILGFIFMFWTRPVTHVARPIPADPPSVDIFIATYNEPVDLLEHTVVAAKQLNYPKDKLNVYICDDGDRAQMRNLAKKWGVNYLRRDDNRGAKAGNLNNAMAHSTGELVVTMDADMVLKPEFLQESVGYFHQQHDLAFVQTPQAFHNPDIFQHNLYADRILRNDQDFFMRFIEPAYSKLNATLYIGSNAIFRRTALEEIGGFVEDVITEDMATGIVLHDHGWKSIYLNKVLATGLSPETYPELLKQRIRWGRGNIQVLKKYGPSTQKNLTFAQKWVLLNAVQFWFFGIFHFFNWALPVCTLVFGLHIIRSDAYWFIPLWAVQFMLSRLVYESISKGRFKSTWTMIYELAQGPQVGWAVLQELLLGKSIGFHVTSKDNKLSRAHFALRQSLPQIILYLTTLTIFILAIYRMGAWEGNYLLAHIIPLVWLGYYAICLFAATLVAIDQPRQRHYLEGCETPAQLELPDSGTLLPVTITGVHTQRACFALPEAEWDRIAMENRGVLYLTGGFDPIPVNFEQARLAHDEVYVFAPFSTVTRNNYQRLCMMLNDLNTERFTQRPSRKRLVAYDATLGMMMRRRPHRREAYLTGGSPKYKELSFSVVE